MLSVKIAGKLLQKKKKQKMALLIGVPNAVETKIKNRSIPLLLHIK
jgi:hypothetical protein